jgi:hypothetical protein
MSYMVGRDVLYVSSSYGGRLRRDEEIGRPIEQEEGTNINNNKVATRIVNKP